MATYQDFDRAQWAARRRVSSGAGAAVATRPGAVTVADILEVYGPLAELVADRAGSAEPFVIAVSGSVAVGKSAAAAALAQAFGTDTSRAPVSVVCTDGFLYPNRELSARGLMERKGFPESFDHDALARFLVTVRGGAPETRAPVYSHATYDIVEGETQVVEQPSVHTTDTGARVVSVANAWASAAAAALFPTATLPLTARTNGAVLPARSATSSASGP